MPDTNDAGSCSVGERLLRIGFSMALVVLLLVWPLVLGIDHFFGEEIVPVGQLLGADEVAVNRAGFDPEFVVEETDSAAVRKKKLQAEIASMYALNPLGVVRYVFVSDDDIVRPEEDPSIALVVFEPGDWQLQAKSLYFVARMTTMGAGGAALLLFVLLTILRRRRATGRVTS